MVPVTGPIIDYENPFYCPGPRRFHLKDALGTDPDLVPYRSPHTLKSATTSSAHNFDAGSNKSSIYAVVRRQNRFQDRVSERLRRKSADVSYDSSPCASYLDERRRNRKRARYTGHPEKLTSLVVPDGERKRPCKIKQEHSSPFLFPVLDDHVATQGHKEKPVPDLLIHDGGRMCKGLGSSMENTVTTQALLWRLEEAFPYIGFREAADAVRQVWREANDEYRTERHQALVDLLGARGALNEFVLTALHDAEFRYLDLGPTMGGVNTLDLPLGDIMGVFGHSGWFKNLKMLSFAGGRFRDDFVLANIRPFCQIEALVLTNTDIGNEGVYHIVALKRKLLHLELSDNPLINDDSIPALILLEKLQHLSIDGTGILMPGIRRLAMAMKEGERVMNVRVPSKCKDYIAGMHNEYILYPTPPLISYPGVVSILSESALSRNLEAHAAVNPRIVSTGPRNEMEERLTKILEVRTLDLAVREMLVGHDEAR